MKAIIYNYDTGTEISKISVKNEDFSKIIKEIELIQRTEDVLKLGEPCVLKHGQGFGLGILEFFECSGFSSSFSKDEDCMIKHTGATSCIIGDMAASAKQPEPIEVLKDSVCEKKALRVGIVAYREGFVLSVGKSSYGILGNSNSLYFSKITSKNFKCTSKKTCKAFDSPKKLQDYIKNHEDVFEFMVSQYGYSFKVEYVTKYYQKDIESLSSNQADKFQSEFDSLNQYLEVINNTNTSAIDNPARAIPENITSEDMFKEAEARMNDLEIIKDAIQKFKKGELFMSEGGGILYTLDDNAKAAVKIIEKYNYLPYHVMHTITEAGDLYDVLYVSTYSEEWEAERYNQKDCCIDMAYVYNASCPDFSEFGSIRLSPANGGVKKRYD